MSVAHRWLLAPLVMTLLLAATSSLEGNDGMRPRPLPCFLCDLYSEGMMGWYERELEQKGFRIDNASLIRSLRDNATVLDRALMIHLLVLRGVPEVESVLVDIVEGNEDFPVSEEHLRLREIHPNLLEEDQSYLRREAAVTLVQLGNDVGLAALRDLMRSTAAPAFRLSVAADLARFGDLSGFRYLAEASESEDAHQRRSSIEGISWAAALDGTTFDGAKIDAIDRLRALGKDEDPSVRLRFLRQISEAHKRDVNPWVYRDIIKDLERDPDVDVRGRASFLLYSGVLKE